MALKKKLRKGGRYILFKQYGNKNKEEIMDIITKYVGLIDLPPIKFIEFNGELGIIKTNIIGYKKVVVSLILSSEENYRIEVLDASGTIKSLKERNKI